MHVSILSFTLGTNKVNVKSEYLKRAPEKLNSFEKAGFKFVHHASSGDSVISMLKQNLQTVPFEILSNVDTLIGSSTVSHYAPHWVHELNSNLPKPQTRRLYGMQDACNGFLSALELASALIDSGKSNIILIAIGDTYSKYFKNTLKNSTLFSDAASITLVSRDKIINSSQYRSFKIDPLFSSSINEINSQEALDINDELLKMNGARVYQVAISSVSKLLENISNKYNLEEMDWFLHQGSKVLIDELEHLLGSKKESLFRAELYGNTVGNSIPIQLHGSMPKNQHIGLLSFGMGLSSKIFIGKWQTS